MKIKLVTASLFIIFFSGCTSTVKNNLDFKPAMNAADYKALISKNSFKKKEYNGFYNQFDLTVTYLTTEVSSANLDQLRYYHQWPDLKYQKQREELFQTLSNKSKIFLSFFTPEVDLRNLQRPDSLWDVFLEVDGQRYKGEITAHNESYYLLKQLYPFHTKWSTGYILSFDVPMTVIETQNSKLILTSPAGKAIFTKSPI